MTQHPAPSTQHSAWLHRIALLTAIATFPLIFMGGLVTSHQAGMSVPDWPNSYGYNMFLFPPHLWIGGILYEHTHRLMATIVGFLSIILTIAAWKTEPRPWAKWLATSVLFTVILQGVLGGLRVVLVKLDLAIVHACLAQAFFCLAALTALVTSKWWQKTSGPTVRPSTIRLAVICVLMIYLQLIIGATMRHYQAGLAIPDLPLAYGKLLPPTTQAQLDTINQDRIWNLNLEPVTLTQIWLHFAHRIGACFVTAAVLALVTTILIRHRRDRDLLIPAWMLSALLIVQLGLGILTVYLRKPADIASAHVAVGALVLVTAFVIAVRTLRLYSLHPRLNETVRETFARDQRHSGLHVVPA
jgi:cytochrome c oxidase assembly protein subunit 15